MPTLHAEDHLIPKSTLRHRPISIENTPSYTPTTQRASRNKQQRRRPLASKKRAETTKQTFHQLH